MPEKPEVITVTKKLEKRLLGRKITDCKVYYEPIIDYPSSKEFIKKIKNQTINSFSTRGKWIVIELDTDYLLVHLRMEGKFFYREINSPLEKHHHVVFTIDNSEELHFQDVRKFGRMKLIPKEKINDMPPFTELGLEPWDKNLTVDYLKEHLKNKKIPIKTALLDQSIITGIGNIYDDEILFLSHINPLTPANQVSSNKLKEHITELLDEKSKPNKVFLVRNGISNPKCYGVEKAKIRQKNKLCYVGTIEKWLDFRILEKSVSIW